MDSEDRRSQLIFGEMSLQKVQQATVLVAGVGGVGGYACEVLIRLGVKRLIVVDGDVVKRSNINRQILSHQENIGHAKVQELSARAKLIRPDMEVVAIQEVLHKGTLPQILETFTVDLILDAIDSVGSKSQLIAYALNHGIAVVSSLGVAQRLNPQELVVIDLNKTTLDPLARALRKALRKLHVQGPVPTVFSTELPIKSVHDVAKQQGSKCLGSYVAVVMTAGALLADTGIKLLLAKGE
jgi:tRNA threonylcarbamoyladenosine dehydratase